MADSARTKHLEMIQGIINRLSTNSFLLKGWSVVLVSALFALAAKESKGLFAYVVFFPAFIFWFLDGYFLAQERLFRRLYDKVRALDDDAVDFSMNTTEFKTGFGGYAKAVLSKTLLAFHLTVVVVSLLAMAIVL